MYVHAASIYVVTAVVAIVVAAAVSVRAIVPAAQGDVHNRHGRGLQSIAVGAAVVTDWCNFALHLR